MPLTFTGHSDGGPTASDNLMAYDGGHDNLNSSVKWAEPGSLNYIAAGSRAYPLVMGSKPCRLELTDKPPYFRVALLHKLASTLVYITDLLLPVLGKRGL